MAFNFILYSTEKRPDKTCMFSIIKLNDKNQGRGVRLVEISSEQHGKLLDLMKRLSTVPFAFYDNVFW